MIPYQTALTGQSYSAASKFEQQFAAPFGVWIDRYGFHHSIEEMTDSYLYFTERMLINHFVRALNFQLPINRETVLVLVTLSGNRKLREIHDEWWRRHGRI